MRTGVHSSVIATLAAAVLFGAGTPLAKLLRAHTSPWLLAALLYLGSGIGFLIVALSPIELIRDFILVIG